jgi:hypothetical protein
LEQPSSTPIRLVFFMDAFTVHFSAFLNTLLKHVIAGELRNLCSNFGQLFGF